MQRLQIPIFFILYFSLLMYNSTFVFSYFYFLLLLIFVTVIDISNNFKSI